MGQVINLEYVAGEFIDLLRHLPEDPPPGEMHMLITDAYYKLCARAGIGDKTAVMALNPWMSEEQYLKTYKNV